MSALISDKTKMSPQIRESYLRCLRGLKKEKLQWHLDWLIGSLKHIKPQNWCDILLLEQIDLTRQVILEKESN